MIAAVEAERLIKELGIDSLPIDPIAIAESLGILVQPKTTTGGVSGMLIRVGNELALPMPRISTAKGSSASVSPMRLVITGYLATSTRCSPMATSMNHMRAL